MGKINPVSAKYIVHTSIQIEGVVDKPDVIGAIFGQTEGLLGADLELRELQRSGKIGRIEVNLDTRGGKTKGEIILPSSLDKAETAIVAAALEIIQRIGPCNAKVKVENIEDVRVSKRQFVIERAKELLRQLTESVLPDSQELADEVAYSVRVMEIQEYGRERLPAGPAIDESDEIIVVEGRADVLNLLKHGFKNSIAINGTSVPETIVELCKRKIVTVFVDGDRGGNLIVQEILAVTDVDYITRAPDGKEVEEITKKEIHKAIRSRIAAEQVKLEIGIKTGTENGTAVQPIDEAEDRAREFSVKKPLRPIITTARAPERPITVEKPIVQERLAPVEKRKMSPREKQIFTDMLEDLIGTKGAYILDEKLNILGKVPVTELLTTIKSLNTGMYAVILDGVIDRDLIATAEKSNVFFLVAMDAKAKGIRTEVVTGNDL